MEIFGVGTTELVIILLLAVIVLGPNRLARSAHEAGKLIRNIKAYFSTLSDELKTELNILDDLQGVEDDLKKL